jgi:hypothetical protein
LSPTKTPSAPPSLGTGTGTGTGTGSASMGCKALNLMCMIGTTPKCENGAWRCQNTGFVSYPSLSPTKPPSTPTSTSIADSKAPTKTK